MIDVFRGVIESRPVYGVHVGETAGGDEIVLILGDLDAGWGSFVHIGAFSSQCKASDMRCHGELRGVLLPLLSKAFHISECYHTPDVPPVFWVPVRSASR